MQFDLTPEVESRVNQGIADAQRQIDREMTYRPDLRNAALIASSEAHIAKMRAALASGVLVSA